MGDRRGLVLFERLFALLIIVSFVAVALSFSVDPRKRLQVFHDLQVLTRAAPPQAPSGSAKTRRTVAQLDAALGDEDVRAHRLREAAREVEIQGRGAEEAIDLVALVGDDSEVRVIPETLPEGAGPVLGRSSPGGPVPPDAGVGLRLALTVDTLGAGGQPGESTSFVEPTLLHTPGASARSRKGPLISGVERPKAPPATPRYLPGSDGRGIFVPSRLGLPVKTHTEDVWSGWAEANRVNITGTEGTEVLRQAFQAVADSRVPMIAQSLIRRGIAISFGTAEDFVGERSAAIAFFHYSRDDRPPQAPSVLPEIKFNPAFKDEHPFVLAAALIHEGTHLQQYLEGSLLSIEHLAEEFEFDAWWNEAAFWEGVRGEVWPIDSPLERELDFSYHTALQGEARVRELLTALEVR